MNAEFWLVEFCLSLVDLILENRIQFLTAKRRG